MNVTWDICCSISANCSNSTSMTNTDSGTLCVVFLYTGAIMSVLILPFNIWALYRGRRTVTVGGGSSDILTLNLISTCVIVCLTYILYFISFHHLFHFLSVISMLFDVIGFMAQAQFQSWICVEHCLAVVFPIFYLRLKQLRYKLVWVCFTWFTSLFYGGLIFYLNFQISLLVYVLPFLVLFGVIVFCSLTTLTVLKQPRTGGGNSREMHFLKTKAFRIIMLMLVVLIIGYLPFMCVSLLEKSLSSLSLCVARIISLWLIMPVCVLHSILYLSRFIKIPCTSQA